MEKKIIIFVLAASMLLMTGCNGKPAGKAEILVEGKDYSIQVSSSVKKKECCICGDNERSLMAYYRKSNMLGLVFLNTMDMASLDTRIYSDDGTKIIEDGQHITISCYDGCSLITSGQPSRGIFGATIDYGEDGSIDFGRASRYLCQDCLQKVADMYKDTMDSTDGEGFFPEVCIVDFATNELYTLGLPYTGFNIRDFWIQIDHGEEQDTILAIYAPEGSMPKESEDIR